MELKMNFNNTAQTNKTIQLFRQHQVTARKPKQSEQLRRHCAH